MKNKIHYSKNIQWLKPLVDSAKDLVPLTKISHIISYKVNKGCNELVYGSTVDGEKYKIYLKIADIQPDRETYKPTRYCTLIETLAHELAHTVYWEHDYKHFKLTALILLKFSGIIKKMKIRDISARIK